GGKLIPWRHLPGQPEQDAIDRLTVDALSTGNGSALAFRVRLSRRNIKTVCDRFVNCKEARRREKPQLIFFDRSALGQVDVPVKPDLVDDAYTVRLKKTREIVALQRRAFVSHKRGTMEFIAAFLWVEVDPQSSSRRVGDSSARLVNH